MIPGINPRDMAKAMKRLGIKQEEVEALEVIIRTADREIIIANPQVSKVNMMGQETWQITGEAQEHSREMFSEEDVKTVMERAGVSEDKAKEALTESNGNLAEAILTLKQ